MHKVLPYSTQTIMSRFLDRAERLLGEDMLKSIAEKKVLLFGVGGVGSWCAEGLVRSGIQNLTIVDPDCVSESNINRQLMATSLTIGQVKVEAMKAHLLEINPQASITALKKAYTKETNSEFNLTEYDYIVDCIDSLKDKYALLIAACNTPAKVFSSMGAALKTDPTQVKVAEYWKVRGCPLGAALRKKMKQSKVKLAQKVQCVYSEELLENKGNTTEQSTRQINGSLVHITAIFGFTLSGLVLNDIIGNATADGSNQTI